MGEISRNVSMKVVALIVVACSVFGAGAIAQDEEAQLVAVAFRVSDVGTYDLEVLIRGNEAYLPALTTFGIIGIKVDTADSQRRLEGFLRSADSTYFIDVSEGTASYADHRYAVTANDYMMRGSDLYLSTRFIKELFALDIRFLSRRLQVDLRNTRDLPVFLMNRRRAMMQR